MRQRNQTGHRDRFSKDKTFNDLLMSCRGHEKKVLYAWSQSDGKLLCTPSDSLEQIMAMREEMQEKCNAAKRHLLLDRFFYEGTEETLYPPPNPSQGKRTGGGHAVGGPPDLKTAEDLLPMLVNFAQKQLARFEDTVFYVKENSAFMERGNVRIWITRSDDLGVEKPLKTPFKWSAYVSMIKNWNEDYHDVHLGNFTYEYDAIEEAMAAFVRYQVIEGVSDYY